LTVPEGDTVWRTARLLDRALGGRVLTATDFRVPAYASWDLAGATVSGTVSRGKHLLTRIEGDSAWTLHTHLKMEGGWRVLRPGARWPRPAHTARVVLTTADSVAVGFALGVVDLVARDRESDLVGHLGPDLLGPDWDPEEAVRRLGEQSDRTVEEARPDQTRRTEAAPEPITPHVTIGAALLDQRNLAGLGTVYVSELLFLAGVSPRTPTPYVPDLSKVVHLAHRLLTFNAHGRSPVQVTTGDTRRGQEHYVYLRTGQPCRRCGSTVVDGLVGPPTRERRLYWCPSCQPPRGGEG
jgi:endonuclease-8